VSILCLVLFVGCLEHEDHLQRVLNWLGYIHSISRWVIQFPVRLIVVCTQECNAVVSLTLKLLRYNKDHHGPPHALVFLSLLLLDKTPSSQPCHNDTVLAGWKDVLLRAKSSSYRLIVSSFQRVYTDAEESPFDTYENK
jgi:hypothetical protein